MTPRVCGLPCEVYSRVVGYLRPVQQWNKGKRAEYRLRRVFATPRQDDSGERAETLRERYSDETLVGWGY